MPLVAEKLNEDSTFPNNDTPSGQLHGMQLYKSEVVIDGKQAKELEEKTREQASSDLWHSQRKLRITASIMKEVCHRRVSTSCTAFVKKRINCVSLNTTAIHYGREHEKHAIDSYVNYQFKRGVAVEVQKCGLVVDALLPWLAASPDAIVSDPTLKEDSKGCLEVKCPLSCENLSIFKACRTVAAFCLVVERDGNMCLSKSHSYFYQLQTQMHVTSLQWCDFVVWSPLHEPFVQRIKYDADFMKSAISTAGKFYFEQFLPAVVPYMIMPPTSRPSPSSSVPPVKSPSSSGLQRDIIVVTASHDGSTYARKYFSQPPPLPKMKGGVFVPLTTEDLCSQWKLWKHAPLLIIYNGQNHYDSTTAVNLN